MLDRLPHTDGSDHVALSAWRNAGDGTTEPIGVARCVRLAAGGDTVEAAIAVVDHMQTRGVGRLLLADLCDAARERGIPGAPGAEPSHGILLRMLGSIARGLATPRLQHRRRRRAGSTN